jgi:molybdenum cofactor biosynthesis enzyme MoaA
VAVHLPVAGRRWIEIAHDYRCNLRCIGCRACEDTGERASPDRAELLREAHAAGVRSAWFGGGEPTLREDLQALVRHARALRYEAIRVQTNGLRLAYPVYAPRRDRWAFECRPRHASPRVTGRRS